MPLATIFQLYRYISYIDGGNWRKSAASHTNFIT